MNGPNQKSQISKSKREISAGFVPVTSSKKADFQRSLHEAGSHFWIYPHALFMAWLLPLAPLVCHGLFTEPLVNPLAVNSGAPGLIYKQLHKHMKPFINIITLTQ